MQITNYYNHKIAFEVIGQGIPLVFLHGFGEDRRMWTDFLPYFDEFQLIIIDFPGSGDSDEMEVSIARMAKIVNAVLLKVGIKKCILIGHSMGGYVAVAFAKLYEKKLMGYCLFHSQPYADSEEKKMGRNKAIKFIHTHGAHTFFKGLFPKLFALNFLKKEDETVQKLIDYASKSSLNAVIYQLKAMRDRPDNQVVLRESKIPVCFIIGKQDVAVPEKNSLDQTFLPKIADIHILLEVGHMGMFEAKEGTASILKNFINFVTNN